MNGEITLLTISRPTENEPRKGVAFSSFACANVHLVHMTAANCHERELVHNQFTLIVLYLCLSKQVGG